MSANIYEVGDLVRCYGVFTDQDSVALDPTNVFFSYKNPAGTITTLTYGVDAALVKSGVGNYYVDITVPSALTATGTWYYRFYSTGTGQTANEALFVVPVTNFF